MEKQMRADTHGAMERWSDVDAVAVADGCLCLAWSGLVGSGPGLLWLLEDMPFSGVLYVTVPHLRLAGFVEHRHTHT